MTEKYYQTQIVQLVQAGAGSWWVAGRRVVDVGKGGGSHEVLDRSGGYGWRWTPSIRRSATWPLVGSSLLGWLARDMRKAGQILEGGVVIADVELDHSAAEDECAACVKAQEIVDALNAREQEKER